ncbi:MAG: hypothetical protein JXL80_04015 [Planctomycetes bacterium]|nr:hypothetical protein [Planctomycetota bacterium]
MKSEERHDLATNELAKAVGDAVSRGRNYTTHILVVLILIVGLAWAGYEWHKSSQQVAAEEVLSLMPAEMAGLGREPALPMAEILDLQIKELDKYIAKYPDSSMINLAKFSRAGKLYDRGMMARTDVADVAEAEKFLKEAAQAFDGLKGVKGHIGELSKFGSICVAKALGNKDEAISQLSKLAESDGNALVAQLAEERTKVIRDGKPLIIEPNAEPQKKVEAGEGAANETSKPDAAAEKTPGTSDAEKPAQGDAAPAAEGDE